MCANNTRSLVNSLFGVKIFNSFPYFISSPLSSGRMDGASTDLFFLMFYYRITYIKHNHNHQYINFRITLGPNFYVLENEIFRYSSKHFLKKSLHDSEKLSHTIIYLSFAFQV